MVRIAHLADTHLGYKQYNLEEREKDIYEVLEEIGDKILEEHADLVIHSGDLFDSPRPTTQAYYAFKRFLKRLEGKKFFAVLGDHDKPKARGMPPHKLFDDQIQTLGAAGVPEHQQIVVNGKNVLVVGISHLSRTYRQVLVEELKKLERLKTQCDCNILVLHEAIDKFFPFEDAYEIALTELPKTFRYYAMGHLHARIKASYGQGELAYPGSSEIIRSDEIASWNKIGKGFYIVDINGEEVEVTGVNLERIRPQMEFRINYAHFKDELKELVNDLGRGGKLPIVHVEVEGRDIDRQNVHQVLSNALTGKVLTFRQTVVEEDEMELPELKAGAFHINQILKDYFKDEEIALLAIEMLKLLRQDDMDGAKSIADAYFQKLTKVGKK